MWLAVQFFFVFLSLFLTHRYSFVQPLLTDMRGNFSNASHYSTIIEKIAVISDTWITLYNTKRFLYVNITRNNLDIY